MATKKNVKTYELNGMKNYQPNVGSVIELPTCRPFKEPVRTVDNQAIPT
jgi:hypothetical protein